jgi:hypothetical protein
MRQLADTVRRLLMLDWAQLTPGLALRLMPALVIVLGAGLLMDDPRAAAVAVSGAFTVGFGTFQQFTRHRAAPMLSAWIGIGTAAFLGTLAGNSTAALALAAMVFAFWCGLLPALGMGAFWIGQQCTVFLLIAGAYSGGVEQGLARAGLIMAGGLVQMVSYTVIVALERDPMPGLSPHRILADSAIAFSGLRFHVRLRSPYFAFALRCAAALGVAVVLERQLAIPNGYWVAMTALLLMRPDFQDVLPRSLGRIGGTIAGAGLASLVSHALGLGHDTLAALVVALAFLAFATLRLNYGVFALFLTGYVVFLLVLAGLAEAQVVAARIESTAFGATIALAAQLDFYVRRRSRAAPAQTRRG